jgi:hypothetical protein
MQGGSVIDRDRGFGSLKRRWMGAKGRGVATGIFGQGAVEEHGEGITNLLVALVAEFGAPSVGVPARSWCRAFVDEHAAAIKRRVRALAVSVVKGRLTEDQALGQLGAWVVGAMQARIANKIPPPLKPSTVERRLAKSSRKKAVAKAAASRGGKQRKGESSPSAAVLTPLIDTGQFRQSITWEVRDKANAGGSK